MKFGNTALTFLAASDAMAMPSKVEQEPRNAVAPRAFVEGAVQEHHEKRFIWYIALAGVTFTKFVNDFLHFMDDPPHAWETESGNCASKSSFTWITFHDDMILLYKG